MKPYDLVSALADRERRRRDAAREPVPNAATADLGRPNDDALDGPTPDLARRRSARELRRGFDLVSALARSLREISSTGAEKRRGRSSVTPR